MTEDNIIALVMVVSLGLALIASHTFKAALLAWKFRDHEKWSCYQDVFKKEGFEADWSGLSREVILLWMEEFEYDWSDTAHAWVRRQKQVKS